MLSVEEIISKRFALDADGIAAFQAEMLALQKPLYREMPWRQNISAYAVWISESMLQQTQVNRVIPKFESFMHMFPTPDALAAASAGDVLEAWQGLGYNRRALALKRAAEIISVEHGGKMPTTQEELMALPGVGPATSAGIMAFAYDTPSVYLETNVRSVLIHHFFFDESQVKDKILADAARLVCPKTHVRQWYWGLLDYGSHLKKVVGNPSRKAAAYTKQSKFEGSHRQKRSFLVRRLLALGSAELESLTADINEVESAKKRGVLSLDEVEAILQELAREGFCIYDSGKKIWRIIS